MHADMGQWQGPIDHRPKITSVTSSKVTSLPSIDLSGQNTLILDRPLESQLRALAEATFFSVLQTLDEANAPQVVQIMILLPAQSDSRFGIFREFQPTIER